MGSLRLGRAPGRRKQKEATVEQSKYQLQETRSQVLLDVTTLSEIKRKPLAGRCGRRRARRGR